MLALSRIILALSMVAAFAHAQGSEKAAQSDKANKQAATSPEKSEKPALPANGNSAPRDPSLAAIDQYEVRISHPAAGRAAVQSEALAEIVNPFSNRKRGRFYGSLYEFHRNDNFDARNFFDPVGRPLPEYKRNQFGLSFGTILKDRLTLFGTYDGLRINRGATLLSHIPTPAMRQGDLSGLAGQLVDPLSGMPFENNRIPGSRIHPVARRLMQTLPDPNRDDTDRNFVNNQPAVENTNTITSRVDYEFSNDTKLFGQYSYTRSHEGEVYSLPAFGTTQTRYNHSFYSTFTHAFSPQTVGSFRFHALRWADEQLGKYAGQSGLVDSLGIEGITALDPLDEEYPSVYLAGYANIGLMSRTASPRTAFRNTFDSYGSLTFVRGNHDLHFGSSLESRQINGSRAGGLRRGYFSFSGTYTGDAFADFLLGIPQSAERGVGSDRADLRNRNWRISFRDSWKINSRVNLSLSLAYNRNPLYRSIRDNVSIFLPLQFEPPLDGSIVTVGSQEAAEKGLPGLKPGWGAYPDCNDWEPGIGLAFNPLGNNRLVIRGSYEINYDPLDSRVALDSLGRNYPFYYLQAAESSPDSPDLDLSHPFATDIATELTIRAVDPHIRNAYIQDWRLVIQNEFWRSWNLEIAYEGSKTTRSVRTIPANVPLPGKGKIQKRRPNPDYGRFDIAGSGGSSNSHALELGLRKRLSYGFSLDSGFSWNRSFSDSFGLDPANPRNLAAERSVSSYYPAKRFYLNYIYDLPLGRGRAFPLRWTGKMAWIFEGWRLSGITSLRDGTPFSPRVKGDPNNDGVVGDRPDRIGSGVLDASQRSIDRWFATEDFALPAKYAFGNSGTSIIVGPGEKIWDISLIKRTKISGDGNLLEFRVQFFNAFNHVNFDRPSYTYGTTLFGKIFGADHSREIEVALKYTF